MTNRVVAGTRTTSRTRQPPRRGGLFSNPPTAVVPKPGTHGGAHAVHLPNRQATPRFHSAARKVFPSSFVCFPEPRPGEAEGPTAACRSRFPARPGFEQGDGPPTCVTWGIEALKAARLSITVARHREPGKPPQVPRLRSGKQSYEITTDGPGWGAAAGTHDIYYSQPVGNAPLPSPRAAQTRPR